MSIHFRINIIIRFNVRASSLDLLTSYVLRFLHLLLHHVLVVVLRFRYLLLVTAPAVAGRLQDLVARKAAERLVEDLARPRGPNVLLRVGGGLRGGPALLHVDGDLLLVERDVAVPGADEGLAGQAHGAHLRLVRVVLGQVEFTATAAILLEPPVLLPNVHLLLRILLLRLRLPARDS